MLQLKEGKRKGRVTIPPSKSHLHRLLIADFLGGNTAGLEPSQDDSKDIEATKRCLKVLSNDTASPSLDCGESGSTLRFIRPIAAALGKKPEYILRGRLASRPDIIYDTITPGLHNLPGNISSQFATGLLFALPLLNKDSEIRFTEPLESRGYVDLTLSVLRDAGIEVKEIETGFLIRGNQKYTPLKSLEPELDWSGAAFWFSMNCLGSEIEVEGLNPDSAQPDSAIQRLLAQKGGEKDMSQCPDIFPTLAAAAAAQGVTTTFVGIERLRIKESNRIESVDAMLRNLGIRTEENDKSYIITGESKRLSGNCLVNTFNDHRIAMSAAVAATAADAPITIDNETCASKSYPDFFNQLSKLSFL